MYVYISMGRKLMGSRESCVSWTNGLSGVVMAF